MKKLFKILFCFVILISTLGFLSSCLPNPEDMPNEEDNKTDNILSSEDEEKRKQIYQLAVQTGYTGTYEEWLDSIRGDQVELSMNETHIVWRYSTETTWRNLIPLSAIKGDKGDTGLSAYEIYLKYHSDYTGTEEEWINDLVNGNLVSKRRIMLYS